MPDLPDVPPTMPATVTPSGPDTARVAPASPLWDLATLIARWNASAVVAITWCPRCEEWRGPHDCEAHP